MNYIYKAVLFIQNGFVCLRMNTGCQAQYAGYLILDAGYDILDMRIGQSTSN